MCRQKKNNNIISGLNRAMTASLEGASLDKTSDRLFTNNKEDVLGL